MSVIMGKKNLRTAYNLKFIFKAEIDPNQTKERFTTAGFTET